MQRFSENPYEPPPIRAEIAPPQPRSLFEQRLEQMELRVRTLERWIVWLVVIGVLLLTFALPLAAVILSGPVGM